MILYSEKLVLPSPLQKWENKLFRQKGVNVFIKRDDLIHPILSGNKYRKLKFNLLNAEKLGFRKILSFGGAYSNHLYAMAGVAKFTSFEVEMIVRGEELNEFSSPTLKFAADCGVQLTFVNRTAYRNKEKLSFERGQGSFVIPEGGSNKYCLTGIHEMISEVEKELKPTHICAAMGSGGTVAGICSAPIALNYQVIGVPVLKNSGFLLEDISKLLTKKDSRRDLELLVDYHFGGYAKYTPNLLQFIESFEEETQIPLEHVYTGKLFYAIKNEIETDYFPSGSSILIYHSGGIQGKIKKAQP